MADVPLLIISENSSSERRITPSWTIAQLKARLEPITGVPAGSQRLSLVLKGDAAGELPVEAADEEATQLASFPLRPYLELRNYTDTSGVDKYVMPEEEYAKKTDSVLAWKRNKQLGRFDPRAPEMERARVAAIEAEVQQRGIAVGLRCRVGGEDSRRGNVRYVGAVPEIPGGGAGPWVGVHLDEPAGKNDGSIGGTRYWGADEARDQDQDQDKNAEGEAGPMKHGVFVRPDRVEVGDWPPLDDLEEMEEI